MTPQAGTRQPTSGRVLLVDDDDRFRERLAQSFHDHDWTVFPCPSGHAALETVLQHQPSHAVVDLRMPGMDGLDLLQRLLRVVPTVKVIVLTGYGSIATALEAVRLGAVHYLTKPANFREIVGAFESATESRKPESDGSVPTLARAEWEHIQRVLAACDGNVTKAARLLGLHRRSLQRKLAKFPSPG